LNGLDEKCLISDVNALHVIQIYFRLFINRTHSFAEKFCLRVQTSYKGSWQLKHEKFGNIKTIKKRQFEFCGNIQVKTTRTSGYLWEKLWQERTRTSKKNVLGPTQGLAEFKHSTYLAASLIDKVGRLPAH